jgi:hypothetical protein
MWTTDQKTNTVVVLLEEIKGEGREEENDEE